jgi:hypothetical protein
MISLLLHLFRFLPILFGSHRHLALENLALRHQLAVYKQTLRRPKHIRATGSSGYVYPGCGQSGGRPSSW